MLVSLLPLALVVAIVWLLLRATARRGAVEAGQDSAATFRRFLLYALCYVTMLVAAQGVVLLADELAEDQRSNAALASAISFLIVGLPAYGGLVRWVDRRLAGDIKERRSPAWTVYLNLVLATTLIMAMIEANTVLRDLFAFDDEAEFPWRAAVATVVWGSLWAGHWFVLRRRHDVSSDMDLATGTVVGLAPLAIGAAGLLHVLGDELYNRLADDPDTVRDGPSTAAWLALWLVGAVVWSWYWLKNYRTAQRSGLWYITVVPIGALAGFVALAASSATALHTSGVWFFGDPESTEAVRHFDTIPIMAAIGLVGAVSLLYHRAELGTEVHRSDAIRSYDYLLTLAALVTSIIGLSILLIALFGKREDEGVNTLIAGVTMVLVGGPVWSRFWRTIQRHVIADRMAELRSPWRRIHLFTIFGGGGLAVLIATLAVLTIGLEHALDGTFGRDTLHDARFGLAVLISVTGVAWYHFTVFWAEREEYAPVVTTPPPPTMLQRVVLVSGDGEDVSDRLTEAIGAPVTHWHRTDSPSLKTIDIEELRDLLANRTDSDLLVVVGADEATVIPFTATPSTP